MICVHLLQANNVIVELGLEKELMIAHSYTTGMYNNHIFIYIFVYLFIDIYMYIFNVHKVLNSNTYILCVYKVIQVHVHVCI